MKKNNQHNNLSVIRLFAQFELTRLFLTKRGFFLFTSLAVFWFFILDFIIYEVVQLLRDPFIREKITSWFGGVQLDYLFDWSYSELAIYWLMSIFIFPFITILMTSDQIASDIKRGTTRFLLLRSTHSQLLVGRFLGKALIIAILILFTLLATLATGISRDSSQLFNSIPQLVVIFLNIIVFCLPYVALMSLLNALYRSSKISLLFTFIIIPVIVSFIYYITSYIGPVKYLLYLLPGVQLIDTIQLENFYISSILIPLIQTIIYLVLTQRVLARRSL